MGVGHRQPRVHKQSNRRSGVQAKVTNRQRIGVIHLDILDAQPGLEKMGGQRRIGNRKTEVFPVLFFQLRKALLLHQNAVVDDPDVVRQQRDL